MTVFNIPHGAAPLYWVNFCEQEADCHLIDSDYDLPNKDFIEKRRSLMTIAIEKYNANIIWGDSSIYNYKSTFFAGAKFVEFIDEAAFIYFVMKFY